MDYGRNKSADTLKCFASVRTFAAQNHPAQRAVNAQQPRQVRRPARACNRKLPPLPSDVPNSEIES